MGRLSRWLKRALSKPVRSEWNWSTAGGPERSDPPKPPDFSPDHPRVTYPEPLQNGSPDGDTPKGRVVLVFDDGSEVVLPESDPMVPEFLRVADRMTRPARWKRLFGVRA